MKLLNMPSAGNMFQSNLRVVGVAARTVLLLIGCARLCEQKSVRTKDLWSL